MWDVNVRNAELHPTGDRWKNNYRNKLLDLAKALINILLNAHQT
jgi:hypothetical protein